MVSHIGAGIVPVTMQAEANMDRYLRVKYGGTAGGCALAGDEDDIGHLRTQAFNGKSVGVIPRNGGTTQIFVANEAIAAGAKLFKAASGKVTVTTATTGTRVIGHAKGAAAADGDWIEVITHESHVE